MPGLFRNLTLLALACCMATPALATDKVFITNRCQVPVKVLIDIRDSADDMKGMLIGWLVLQPDERRPVLRPGQRPDPTGFLPYAFHDSSQPLYYYAISEDGAFVWQGDITTRDVRHFDFQNRHYRGIRANVTPDANKDTDMALTCGTPEVPTYTVPDAPPPRKPKRPDPALIQR